MRRALGAVCAAFALAAGAGVPLAPFVPSAPAAGAASAPAAGPQGYTLAAADGGAFDYGTTFHGSMGAEPLAAPVVGMARDAQTGGYWEVAADGGIFAFTAPSYGSLDAPPAGAPVVGMAAMPTGKGYWEVAADGRVSAFGAAPFHGSMGAKPLAAPVVGMAAMPTGGGYWEVAADGGVFAFGAAPFHGSTGAEPLTAPVVGMAADAQTGGYWEVAADGGIFAFAAPFLGSMGGDALNAPIVAMVPGAQTQPMALTPGTAPQVTGVTPTGGPTGGSGTVTIRGVNLGTPLAVTFAPGHPAANVTFHARTAGAETTWITATAPANVAGTTVDVIVTTDGGSSTTGTQDEYTYTPGAGAPPTVTSLQPGHGSYLGGRQVVVKGTDLAATESVSFGSVPATYVHYDAADGSLFATAPAAPATATVDVTVTTRSGTSAADPPADRFTFTAAPTVADLTPGGGTARGGTTVAIAGANLTTVTAVTFGPGHPASTLHDAAATGELTVTAPPGTTGTAVPVTVTTKRGTSTPSARASFTYTT